jgi:ribosomal protein S18 acetylase RimI-like enzyme
MNVYNKFCKKKHKQHANFPHCYLYNIAVDPKYQGKGYSRKLLSPMLARLDEKNLPCYLETQIEKNVSIYQHFKFDVVEKAIIPEINFDSWFMLRKIKK